MGGAWPTRAILACSALLVFAAPAHASTQIGMTATSDADNCTPNTEFMQNTVGTAPGFTPSYDVPSSGVITSWSTKPGPSTGTGARLKVYRPTSDPHTWTVVGESAAKVPLTPDALNTATTRIAVQAGDRIAIRTASGNGGPCDYPYMTDLGSGYSMFSFQSLTIGFDPPTGSAVAFSDESLHELVNIAAAVEPDADGDGFGDETQDQCPGVAGSSNGCPPPPPPVTPPTPPPALQVTAAAKRTQRVLRQHGIVLTVQPTVAGTVTGTASLNLPRGAALIRFKRASKQVAANAKVALKLALTRAQLRRVKAALRHHRLTAKAVLTTSATGQKASVKRFSIRLRP